MTTESIFSESAAQIKALDCNLSAFSTLFAPGKSWDNVRSTTAPYTESRLVRLVRNKRIGFPVVEQPVSATPAANFYTIFASVVDTGGKFATGVNDTGCSTTRKPTRLFRTKSASLDSV